MDYKYTKTNQKVFHFIFGFIGNITIGAVHFGLYWLMYYILGAPYELQQLTADIITLSLLVLIIFIEYKLIRQFFKNGKRFIAIGMLASLLLPVLVTGYCSMIFSSLGHGGFDI